MDFPPRKPVCLTELFMVDRSANVGKLLEALGRTIHCPDRGLIDKMPTSGSDIVQLSFFCAVNMLQDCDLPMQYKMRSLRCGDPLSIINYAFLHPEFADSLPHVTVWRDGESLVYMSMYRLAGKRRVKINRIVSGMWSEKVLFVGISVK